MSNSSSPSYNGGISFIGLLTVVFITLKLCGVIGWSWWLVLLPLILSTGLAIVVLIVLLLIVGGAALFS